MTSLELHPEIAAILADGRRRARNTALLGASGVAAISCAFLYAGAFDLGRYAQAFSTIIQLAADALPPDFSRWRNWGRPLLETLSMSIAGTVLGAAAALVLGTLSARTVVRVGWLREPVRVALNILRSIPGLIWGVIFVAAVGFGPLPGILALGVPVCRGAGEVLRGNSGTRRSCPQRRAAEPGRFAPGRAALFRAAANPTAARGCDGLPVGA